MQLWYANELTGVYFALDHEAKNEEPLVPTEYEDIRLTFNMNYNRPSFFGYEAMPIVENLALHFSLLISDNYAPPRHMNAGELIESWCAENQSAIRVMTEHCGVSNPLHMSQQQSLQWWRYMHKQGDLQQELGDGVFVPRLCLARLKNCLEVNTFFTLTLGIAMIFPESNWVAIVRERKSFMREAKQEVGFVSSDTLEELIGRYLQTYAANLRILPTKNVEDVSRALMNVDLRFKKHDFEVVRPDGFVDIDLSKPEPK